ncbi:MAG: Acg family FMN-binding oxidoreductase [Labedaea sp.]
MSTTESSVTAVIGDALHAAVRAPSPHNTQPWRFAVGERQIDVWLDRDRVLAVADPDAREARMACGAAVLNLQLAVHAAGLASKLDLLPDRERPDLMATLRLSGPRPATPEQQALAAAIERRTTNRRPFIERAVPLPARRALRHAADAEGARLVLLERPSELGEFAGLLRRADHVQGEDPAFLAELRDWVAERADREDGVPRSAGGPRPSVGSVLAMRRFHGDQPGTSCVEHPYEQDPLVAVLASYGDTAADQVAAGLALQRMLLAATVHGLSVSFVSQPIEVRETRTALRELIGGQHYPQAAVRLGYGHPVLPTPRRPVSAVTTVLPPPMGR